MLWLDDEKLWDWLSFRGSLKLYESVYSLSEMEKREIKISKTRDRWAFAYNPDTKFRISNYNVVQFLRAIAPPIFFN